MGEQVDFGYMRVVEAFDSSETASSFLREDGEGGFSSGVIRMAEAIERLRSELDAKDATIAAALRGNEAGSRSMKEAMDRIAELTEALEPFSERLSYVDLQPEAAMVIGGVSMVPVMHDDLCRARAVLEKRPQEPTTATEASEAPNCSGKVASGATAATSQA